LTGNSLAIPPDRWVAGVAADYLPDTNISSASALLCHALVEAWNPFIRPTYEGAFLFLDDLCNLATPTGQDRTHQRSVSELPNRRCVNLSGCFSARRDYSSGVRSFAEPAVGFYNKCDLEPFTLEETLEYAQAAFAGTHLDFTEALGMAFWQDARSSI
jgi:hypothetical protein